MVRSAPRLNPADPDYQLRLLRQEIADLKAIVVGGLVNNGGGGGGGGETLDIQFDGENNHIIVFTGASLNPLTHAPSVPISSLVTPDPTNPHRLKLPSLSTEDV